MKHKYNCVIYWIRNKANDKRYIGQTSVGFRKRKCQHTVELNSNKHYNSYLQHSWNKYGQEKFEFKTLLYCEFEELGYFEGIVIGMFKTLDRRYGYNLTEPRKGGGFRHSEETKKKISKSVKYNPMIGKTPLEVHKLGCKCSWCEATRGNLVGKNHPCWGRRGVLTSFYNKHHTEEAREKIAIGNGAKPFAVFKDGIKTGEWVNQSRCARDLQIYNNMISACLLKKRKTHCGYSFKYSNKGGKA